MIYLIGGAPRCGKTTIAKKLSKTLLIPWISADTIESIVAANTPSDEVGKLFPKSVIRKKTKQSNDFMYSRYSAKEIRDSYIKQAKSSWKAIDALVDCEIKEGNHYIIEGHQLHPKLIAQIENKYGKKNICSLVITRFDVNEIVKGCLKHKAKNDWFIQKTKDKETYYKIAEMLREYSIFFKRESEKFKIDVLNVDKKFLDQINNGVKVLYNSWSGESGN